MGYSGDSLLYASKSASLCQLPYKQTLSPPPLSPSHPENRIKYAVILCCLHRNTQTSLQLQGWQKVHCTYNYAVSSTKRQQQQQQREREKKGGKALIREEK